MHFLGPRPRSGFTLVELVLAIVILGIAVPPFLFALQKGARDAVEAERYSVATMLAIEKMESVIADRHSVNRGYTYVATGNYAAESPIAGFANYSRAVTVTEVSSADLTTPSVASGYKKVVVSVTATDLSLVSTMTSVVCDLSP